MVYGVKEAFWLFLTFQYLKIREAVEHPDYFVLKDYWREILIHSIFKNQSLSNYAQG